VVSSWNTDFYDFHKSPTIATCLHGKLNFIMKPVSEETCWKFQLVRPNVRQEETIMMELMEICCADGDDSDSGVGYFK
jgi:hypothetical protein